MGIDIQVVIGGVGIGGSVVDIFLIIDVVSGNIVVLFKITSLCSIFIGNVAMYRMNPCQSIFLNCYGAT